MSTIVDDPCTDTILEFIAKHESAGNYNAVIGDPYSTNDLSTRTVKGIYALMDDLLQRGEQSTAVGRYQIIRQTMKDLQTWLGVHDTDRFTPQLQDRIGIELLMMRGYKSWREGKIDDIQFAHNISLGWASLPDPNNGGKSHYDGVGLNHAGTTLAQVYAMLKHARSGVSAPPSVSALPAAVERAAAKVACSRAMQQALKNLGVYDGEVDGIWGKRSRTAYNVFQAGL